MIRTNSGPKPVQTQSTQQTQSPRQTPGPQQTQSTQQTQAPQTPSSLQTGFQSHLSQPSSVGTLRPQIAQQTQQFPSFYGSLVKPINSGLQSMGFGISPSSHSSVMSNLQGVNQGTMSQATAHFNEASSFGKDSIQSFMHGRPLAGLMEGSGAVLNTVGGIGMSGLQGLGSSQFGSGQRPPGVSNWD